jgi:hypothetical protein
MYQPNPSSGQPADALRSPAPAPVLTAVKLIYAGAAASAVSLIVSVISLALAGRSGAAIRVAAHSQPLPAAIAAEVAGGLVMVSLWLWMGWASSQGRNSARILSTVLFGMATLKLIGVLSEPRTVLGLIFWAPAWLAGVAAVWLLWRPESGAFFKPQRAGPGPREV